MLSCLQYPTAVHLYIVPSHTKDGIIENFLRDLHIATDKVMNYIKFVCSLQYNFLGEQHS